MFIVVVKIYRRTGKSHKNIITLQKCRFSHRAKIFTPDKGFHQCQPMFDLVQKTKIFFSSLFQVLVSKINQRNENQNIDQ